MTNKESKRRYLTITLTESCNLSCVYCYENHKSSSCIQLETLKKIIKSEMCANNGYDEIEIGLFGGEPFLKFDLIKEIYDYVPTLESNKKYVFFASTNGTLIHGEVKRWLKTHRHFICGLSYDGTPAMNDINRSGSSDMIDLDFFKLQYPDQTIKMTVSQSTLPSLAEGVIYLHEKGFVISCNLAYGLDWSDTENKKILERELMKLIEYYLVNPNIEPCSLLNMPIHNIALLQKKPKYMRYCGAGISSTSYHIDGTAYACQFFTPLSIGEEKAKESLNLKFYDDFVPEDMIEEKCKNCVIQSVCPTCYGSNFAATGNMYVHDDNYCEMTKIIMKARSYFKAMQWKAGQLNLSPAEETLLLKSIQIIQENL